MGGGIAIVVHVELPVVFACAFQDLANSAFWFVLGYGVLIEVLCPPCIVGGLEDVVQVGVAPVFA